MALFAKVSAKKADAAKSKAKGVAWLAGDPSGDAVAKSVKELVRLDAESKAIEARMAIHKNAVRKFAEERYLRDYAEQGSSPDTPMTVQNSDGEKVTYVVQDRSGQYNVSDAQVDALGQLVGPDAVANLLYEERRFGFNREILALPGVSEAVEVALEGVISRLLESGVLSQEQSECLVEASQKTAFKPGTLDRLGLIVGRDVNRLRQFLEVMGSSATRYVKC